MAIHLWLDALPPHTVTYFPPHLEGRGIQWDGGCVCSNIDLSLTYFMLEMTGIRGEPIYLAVRQITSGPLDKRDIQVSFEREEENVHPRFPHHYIILSPRQYTLTERQAVLAIDNLVRWRIPHRMEHFDSDFTGKEWCHPTWGKIIATIQLEEEIYFIKAEKGSGLLASIWHIEDHPDDPICTCPYEMAGNFRSYSWPSELISQAHPNWHEVISRFLDLERHF